MNNKHKSLVLAALLIGLIYMMYDRYCESSLNAIETYEDIQNENSEKQVNNSRQKMPTKDRSQVKPFEEGIDHLNINNPRDASIELGGCGNTGSFISSNLLPKKDSEMQDNSEFAPK